MCGEAMLDSTHTRVGLLSASILRVRVCARVVFCCVCGARARCLSTGARTHPTLGGPGGGIFFWRRGPKEADRIIEWYKLEWYKLERYKLEWYKLDWYTLDWYTLEWGARKRLA